MMDLLKEEFPDAVLRKGGDYFVDVVFRIEALGLDQRISKFDSFAKRIEKFLIGKDLHISYSSFGANVRNCTCVFCVYAGKLGEQ